MIGVGDLKANGQNWVMQTIAAQAKKAGVEHHTRVIMGLFDLRLRNYVAEKLDFYNLDHSYFQRGWHNRNFRAIRNHNHLTTIKKRPDDRIKKFGVTIEPWRKKRGNQIVVIPTYKNHHDLWPGHERWVSETVYRIKKVTDRPIIVKKKGSSPLKFWFDDMWCLVCNGSVAGLETALAGIPVFSGDKCCSYPISAGPVENIEKPELVDLRHELACSLSYASWNASEIEKVKWLDYDYLCDDMPS